MSFLLLKATADQLPLADNSAALVIATPPYLGACALRRHEYGAQEASDYERLMARFSAEASRVLRPSGVLLLHTNYPAVFRSAAGGSVIFTAVQKGLRGRKLLQSLKPIRFRTRHLYLRGFSWPALPVWVYRSLIEEHSRPGELVVHVFSGSGNGGVAALELGRKVLLVDLHYHRRVARRLRKEAANPRRRRL